MATPKKGAKATKGGPDDANDGQNKPASSTAGLEVTATHAGFRRAGLVWSNKPIQVKLADLTDDQVALIKGCPGLTVKEVELADDEEQGDQA